MGATRDGGGHGGRDPDAGTTGTAGTSPDLAVTTAEAAVIAGVSARTIRRWIEKGALPAVAGAGGVLYVFPRDVEAARVASGSRPSPVRRDDRDAAGTGIVRDTGGVAGSSPVSPDPAGDAAGAILVAWRDTVLAPVVAQLGEVTRDLADAREKVGRLEVERDQAARERDDLRAEVERLLTDQTGQDAPTTPPAAPGGAGPTQPAQGPAVARWRRWLRRWAGTGAVVVVALAGCSGEPDEELSAKEKCEESADRGYDVVWVEATQRCVLVEDLLYGTQRAEDATREIRDLTVEAYRQEDEETRVASTRDAEGATMYAEFEAWAESAEGRATMAAEATATAAARVAPPPAGNVLDCGDFTSQRAAQAVLDGDPRDPHWLDDDGDGVACERLP